MWILPECVFNLWCSILTADYDRVRLHTRLLIMRQNYVNFNNILAMLLDFYKLLISFFDTLSHLLYSQISMNVCLSHVIMEVPVLMVVVPMHVYVCQALLDKIAKLVSLYSLCTDHKLCIGP